MAEAAKISYDSMKMEIDKAYKRRQYREKKKQESINLAPAKALQPKSRTIRYDNIKSAVAEEGVLAMILKDPALLDSAARLRGEEFSAAFLGKAFEQLRQRHASGLEVSLSVLTDLSEEEMSHIAGVAQRRQGPVNEQALSDCIRTIQGEHQRSNVSSEEDLLALRDQLKQRKGVKG